MLATVAVKRGPVQGGAACSSCVLEFVPSLVTAAYRPVPRPPQGARTRLCLWFSKDCAHFASPHQVKSCPVETASRSRKAAYITGSRYHQVEGKRADAPHVAGDSRRRTCKSRAAAHGREAAWESVKAFSLFRWEAGRTAAGSKPLKRTAQC